MWLDCLFICGLQSSGKKGVYKYVLILQRDRLSSNLLLNCPVVALYLMNWLTGVSLLPFFLGVGS